MRFAQQIGARCLKSLLQLAEHSAAMYKHHKWPTLVDYRIAYGLATGAWGGKSLGTMT